MVANPLGQNLGLIETAFALPGRMQWHRGDQIEVMFLHTLVVQGGDQPARDLMAKVDLPTVLEIENDPADNASAAKCGDGRIEMKGAMSAISASEGVGNGAIEWLRTFGAKRWDNPADFCFAV